MQTIEYDRFNETVYYEQLPNGLKVYVLPKKGFQKTYATFTTKYGSIDNHFMVRGSEKIQVPDGIAHFLEHKMFEEPEGDIFARFAELGASANAFTSFERTTYLFSATERIQESLLTLLNFVQHPYFTDENVEKEKGIIGQEIKMYQDNPGWRSYYGLIEAMYHQHPIHIDIAGTVESISGITKETLYDCYHTFYHPSNMLLFIVGGVEPDEVMQWVRENQAAKQYEPLGEIIRYYPEEPLGVKERRNVIKLPVSLPKCLFGFKEPPLGMTGQELLKRELITDLMMQTLIGKSSEIYQKLYDENIISDQYGLDYTCQQEYAFSMIGGDTPDPDKFLERMKEEIEQVKRTGLDEQQFNRQKKKRIGSMIKMMNSPESIAYEFTKYQFNNTDMFEALPIYELITLEQVNQRMLEHFSWDQMAVSIVESPAR